MLIKAKITIKLNRSSSKIIHSALKPDNKPLPKDISLNITLKNKKLDVTIEYNGNNPLRLFSTIDEILEATSLVLKTISVAKTFKTTNL
jgi:hypothetical protein